MTRDGDQRAARITKQKEGEDGMVAAHFELMPVVIFGERPCASAVVKHIEKPRAPNQQRVRISSEQKAIIEQVRNYQEGVAMEVLIATVIATREAKGEEVKASVVRQSVRRLIEHALLSCDGGLIRAAPGI